MKRSKLLKKMRKLVKLKWNLEESYNWYKSSW